MSKFGWSLPPGCTTLPGEGADEQAAEAMVDAIYEVFAKAGFSDSDERTDQAADLLIELIGKAYHEGYQAGMSDEGMAQEFKSRNINEEG